MDFCYKNISGDAPAGSSCYSQLYNQSEGVLDENCPPVVHKLIGFKYSDESVLK